MADKFIEEIYEEVKGCAVEVRLKRWKEEFELLYSLSKDDSFEALEECMRLVIRLNGLPTFFGDEILVKDRG